MDKSANIIKIVLLTLFLFVRVSFAEERKPAAGALSYYQCEVQRELNFTEQYAREKAVDFMISLPQKTQESQSSRVNQRWIDIQSELNFAGEFQITITEWAYEIKVVHQASLGEMSGQPREQIEGNLTAKLDDEKQIVYSYSCALVL